MWNEEIFFNIFSFCILCAHDNRIREWLRLGEITTKATTKLVGNLQWQALENAASPHGAQREAA